MGPRLFYVYIFIISLSGCTMGPRLFYVYIFVISLSGCTKGPRLFYVYIFVISLSGCTMGPRLFYVYIFIISLQDVLWVPDCSMSIFLSFPFRMYYGSQIAMYFAWLGFYTQFLIAPSIIGLIIFLYGTIYMTDSYPRYGLLCQPFQHVSVTFK